MHLAFPINNSTGSIAACEPLASVTISPSARLVLCLVRVVTINPLRTGICLVEKPNGEKGYEPSHKVKIIRAADAPTVNLPVSGRIFTQYPDKSPTWRQGPKRWIANKDGCRVKTVGLIKR